MSQEPFFTHNAVVAMGADHCCFLQTGQPINNDSNTDWNLVDGQTGVLAGTTESSISAAWQY